jgi:hypothetical protein
MEPEQQRRIEFQKHLLRMKSDCDRLNEIMGRFFEKGESNDLELLVSWLHDQFLKATIDKLEYENSRASLERMLAQLQKQSTRFQESTSSANNPNQKKFTERWSSEVADAISKVKEQLSKIS